LLQKTAATSIHAGFRALAAAYSLPGALLGCYGWWCLCHYRCQCFPGNGLKSGTYAILGMGAGLAAVIGAPISTTMHLLSSLAATASTICASVDRGLWPVG